MNFRYVARQLSLLAGLLALALAAIATWSSLLYLQGRTGESEALRALGLSAAATAGSGVVLWLLSRRAKPQLGRREALFLVALSWLAGAAYAALPFFLWAHLAGESDHPYRSFVDCYFEATSGLTTTGSSVLGAGVLVETVPASLLFWRALTHWVGGLGIVVLFVAVLPSLGVGGKRLFMAEASGPAPTGLHPQIRQTARVLLYVYLVLSAAQVLALCAAGMGLFDSLCHTFATIASGGFSTKSASIGYYDSTAIHVIVTVFMVLSGVNFAMYFALVRRRFETVWRDPELRTYLALLAGGTLVVAVSIATAREPLATTSGRTIDPSPAQALHYAAFNVTSLATTTGFATADWNPWPFAAHAVIIGVMFVGGSAGSTAGGLKVVRVWMAVKVMLSEVERAFRPQVVRPVRVGRTIIDGDLKLATVAYVLGYILVFIVGAGAVMLLEQWFNQPGACDFPTAASASVACLSNVGPGIARVGAVGDYGWMTAGSKVILSLLMVLGRLEIFPIIVLFNRRFWRGE